jgi:hypothetical protein
MLKPMFLLRQTVLIKHNEEKKIMKVLRTLAFLLVAMSMILAACAPAATEAPVEATEAPATEEAATEAPAATEEPAAGLTCAEPIKVGLITDASGALAHLWRSHPALLYARHGICHGCPRFRW